MANSPKPKTKAKSKPKAPASVAKKSATRSGKTPASRTRVKLADPVQKHVVLGTVKYADGSPAAGLTVVAYDKDDSGTDMLGKPAVTSETGNFSIPYREADFRKTRRERGGADVIVCVYRDNSGKQELVFTSKKRNNAPAEFELEITVPAEQYVVRGTVTDANQMPLVNMFVRAYERDLRFPQLLGAAETGESGEFRIAYSLADFQFADVPARRAPWLIVEVRAFEEGEVLASQEVPKANPDQTVFFTLSSIGAVSEKHRCDEAVPPLLRGQGTPRIAVGTHAGAEKGRSDLAPWDITSADVDFIVRDIQLDRGAIEAWATSSRMARDAGLRLTDEHAEQQALLLESGWVFFYAIARQGLAHDLPGVLREPSAKWQAAWKAARSVNRVRELSEKIIDLLVKTLELLTRLQQLDPQHGGDNPLAKVIASLATPLPKTVALDALQIVQQKGLEDPDALLELAERHPQENAAIKSLVRGVRVHLLAPNDPGLFSKLSARLSGSTTDSIAPLAALTAADWISVAQDTATSGGQALRLLAHVEAQHPIPALEAKIAAGTVTLPGVTAGEIAALIKNEGAKVEKIVQGKLPVKDADTGVSAVHKTLRDLGRFVRTGVSVELGADLMNAGIETPGKALRYGREHIYEQYRERLPKETAREVTDSFFDATELTVNGGKGALIGININRHWPSGLIPAGFEEYKLPLPDKVRENLPSLPGFFGDLDECICRPCESMLGQPAYLVDLLNLLQKNKTAFDRLKTKRPDIVKIKLDCEHAETLVQHIDIVLEILEEEASSLGIGASRTDIERAAYEKLAGAVFPWALSLDLPYAQLKAYLAKLGVARGHLLALRRTSTAEQLAVETLSVSVSQSAVGGIAISQWKLLTEQRTGADVWAAYGFSGASTFTIVDPASSELLENRTPQDLLTRVSVLLDRTGLTLQELEQLLETKFINGDGATLVLTNRKQCKTSEMVFPGTGATLEAYLDRLHRFVRLRTRLPDWSIAQLGQALVALGGVETSQTTDAGRRDLMGRWAVMKRLQLDHDLPVEALIWLPASIANLRKAMGISALQFDILKKITAFDPAAAPFNWLALEDFCKAAKRIEDSGLLIEQVAEALLTRDQLSRLLPTLPPSIKTDEQIEKLLKQIQDRLREAIAAQTDEATLNVESQVSAALTQLFDEASARKLITAIRDAGAKPPLVPVETNDPLRGELIGLLTSSPSEAPGLGEWSPLLDDAQAASILDVSLSNNLDADARFEVLLTGISTSRNKRHFERALIAIIAEQSGLPEGDVAPLLGSRLLLSPAQNPPLHASKVFLADSFWDGITAPPVTRSHVEPLYAWMDRLCRLVALSETLNLDSALMLLANRAMVGSDAGINWRDLLAAAPPSTGGAWANPHWQSLLDLVWLQKPEQVSRPVLADLWGRLAALPATPTTAQKAVALRPLTLRIGLSEEPEGQIELFASQAITAVTAAVWCNPSELRKVFALLMQARHLRASPAQLDQLANLADNAQAATAAKTLLDARLSEQSLNAMDLKAVTRKIEDPLRQQKRDALVAYLVRRDEGDKWKGANDLYEHFLIDPQMEPCFDTTRIVEAITATQLLIQRVLFGLEEGVYLSESDDLRKNWTWMRNYRVWEANRKVFLFPENWLFPELRDDKSSSFKQLESALGQSELNQELAVQSFGQFLDDVAQIGQVQVLGMYEDIKYDQDGHVERRDLYLIGRTLNSPYMYYWRRCSDFGFGSSFMEWSPWQRIEIDITGDHVLIFILRDDLYIAWPQFKRPEEGSARSKIWEINFSWSRLQGDKWNRVETSRAPQEMLAKPFQDERSGFTFQIRTAGNRATLICFTRSSDANLNQDPPSPSVDQLAAQPLTQERKVAFNERCMALRLQNYAQNVMPGQPDIVEVRGPARADLVGAVLDVAWECWVKAKDINENFGYVRLTDGNSPSYRARLYIQSGGGLFASGGSGNFASKGLGEGTGIWVGFNTDQNRLSVPEISFKVGLTVGSIPNQSRGGWSTPVSITTTDADTQKSVCIKMAVVFPTNETPTLAELGIESSRTFTPAASFVLDSAGQAFWQPPPSGLDSLTALSQCDIFMNGQKEDGRAQPLSLVAESQVLSLVPFIPPYDAENPYWAVGAASARDSHKAAADVWFYSEGSSACFVDAHRIGERRYSSFAVYAASYAESAEYRLAWRSDESLFSEPYQAGNFGAKKLPNLSESGDLGFWGEQRGGELAFDARMPYACYNWEVFFHAPLLIADQLSKQHKFEDAERWLRYVFDPTSSESGTDAKRFLKFRVFKELKLNEQVIDDLTVLAQVAGGFGTASDDDAVEKLINRWRDSPFRPFLIARDPRRHIAFLWRTLFAYLDNLLAWADSLYRRDTRESINEATMLYVLAERILGRRPQLHQGTSKRDSVTYEEVMNRWDDFANYWIDVGTGGRSNRPTAWRKKDSIKQPNPDGMLYFCMPFNDKILGYWNIVEARLSNVRNCRNIDGIKRSLPLMDAEIDPELLIRATAAGLDLSDVIAGLYAPPPHYRYNILSARAAELAGEAKSLGAAMLSAIEKRDAEHLAQLRSSNEINLAKLVKDVRTLQISEAESNIEALRGSRRSIESRYRQYQRLLGIKDIKVPGEKESVGEVSMLGDVDLTSNRSAWGLTKEENEQYDGFKEASGWSTAAGIAKVVSGVTHALAAPAYSTEFSAGGAKVMTAFAHGFAATGDAFSLVSQGWRSYAEQQGMMAGHIRRRDEWAFQSNQTLKELQQIDKQILANQIRIDITQKELNNHIEQIEQAKAVDEVMRSKFTNEQLYEWMRTQLYSLYSSAYRMALEMARRAERAAARELGVKPLNILRNDYWDSLRDGLLAGERLHQDIKRLEVTYLDQNRREFELTKNISLRRLNPEALVNLRISQVETVNGKKKKYNNCVFEIPEWLFDLDTPGHYLRRIKSVSVSIPSVVGPYTSINCKLTLLKSSVRHDKAHQTYPRPSTGNTPNFTDYFGATESIVTSTGSGDSGLFETQLRDERFLPFEGGGVISTWRLELPGEYPQFDYSTISDVVLTIRYTARDGGDSLRDDATAAIASLLSPTETLAPDTLIFPVLLSCRSDFPTEWARAKADPNLDLVIPIKSDLLPYWMDAAGLEVKGVRYADLAEDQEEEVQFVPETALAVRNASVTMLFVAPDKIDRLILLDVGR